MGVLCNVEGRLVPPEQALVPVLDRGFLYGDSVYEVVRTYAGRPFEMDRHLGRGPFCGNRRRFRGRRAYSPEERNSGVPVEHSMLLSSGRSG